MSLSCCSYYKTIRFRPCEPCPPSRSSIYQSRCYPCEPCSPERKKSSKISDFPSTSGAGISIDKKDQKDSTGKAGGRTGSGRTGSGRAGGRVGSGRGGGGRRGRRGSKGGGQEGTAGGGRGGGHGGGHGGGPGGGPGGGYGGSGGGYDGPGGGPGGGYGGPGGGYGSAGGGPGGGYGNGPGGGPGGVGGGPGGGYGGVGGGPGGSFGGPGGGYGAPGGSFGGPGGGFGGPGGGFGGPGGGYGGMGGGTFGGPGGGFGGPGGGFGGPGGGFGYGSNGGGFGYGAGGGGMMLPPCAPGYAAAMRGMMSSPPPGFGSGGGFCPPPSCSPRSSSAATYSPRCASTILSPNQGNSKCSCSYGRCTPRNTSGMRFGSGMAARDYSNVCNNASNYFGSGRNNYAGFGSPGGGYGGIREGFVGPGENIGMSPHTCTVKRTSVINSPSTPIPSYQSYKVCGTCGSVVQNVCTTQEDTSLAPCRIPCPRHGKRETSKNSFLCTPRR